MYPIEPIKPSSNDLIYPRYMVFSVLIASLGFFCNGWVTGSANLPGDVTHLCSYGDAHQASSLFPDCLPMNNALWGFAVSSFCVGGCVGGLVGGTIQTKLGRRKTITFNTLGYIFGGLLQGFAMSPTMFIVGRILAGLSCGLGSLVIPTYVGEISTIQARGLMGTINQLQACFGAMLAGIVGLPLSNVPLWRVNYGLVILPALCQGLLMSLCVESPRYLVSVHKIQEAMHALQHLRPGSDVTLELYGMIEGQLGPDAAMTYLASHQDYFGNQQPVPNKDLGMSIMEDDIKVSAPLPTPPLPQYNHHEVAAPMSMMEILQDPLIRKIAMVVIVIHASQQLIGINAVMYYSTDMFHGVFDSTMAKYMSMVTFVVNFVAVFPPVLLIDRMGRRVLLLVSAAGSAVCSFMLTVAYVYHHGPWMVASLFGYVVLFGVGCGPVPWILTSELTPVHASSTVGSMATGMNWSMNFLVGQCFPLVFKSMQGYSFIIFGVIGVLIVLFTFFSIPETRKRSLEDIVNQFKASL